MGQKNTAPGFIAAFFSFKRMISPAFIALAYFIGLLAIVAGTGWDLFTGPDTIILLLALSQFNIHLTSDVALTVSYTVTFFGGLFWILVWRFTCELLIVLFAIDRKVSEINIVLRGKAPTGRPVTDPAVAIPMPAPIASNPPPVDELPKITNSAPTVKPDDDLPPPTSPPASGSSKGWRIRRRRR